NPHSLLLLRRPPSPLLPPSADLGDPIAVDGARCGEVDAASLSRSRPHGGKGASFIVLRAWRRQALEGAVLFASSAVSGSSCHHQAAALLLSAALYADEQGRDPHHGILHSDGRSGAPHCAGTPCCSDPSRWTRYRCAFPYQRARRK
uniref:Uncharacterized protein n=1 Tax=Triticum urartu TaxID=4572 RepID=A0A8R7UQQ7_TRIUA